MDAVRGGLKMEYEVYKYDQNNADLKDKIREQYDDE